VCSTLAHKLSFSTTAIGIQSFIPVEFLSKKIKIHIFCLKPDICSLIKKTFDQTNYYITCSPARSVNDRFLRGISKHFDCVIIDNDIEPGIKAKIKKRFQGIPIICLPSLDSELVRESDIKYISEPLKLSELATTLEDIFKDEVNIK
jgi:hypothetical protein